MGGYTKRPCLGWVSCHKKISFPSMILISFSCESVDETLTCRELFGIGFFYIERHVCPLTFSIDGLCSIVVVT